MGRIRFWGWDGRMVKHSSLFSQLKYGNKNDDAIFYPPVPWMDSTHLFVFVLNTFSKRVYLLAGPVTQSMNSSIL